MEAKRVEELAHHSKTQRHSQRTVLDIHVLKKESFSGLRQVRPLLLLQWVLTCSYSLNHNPFSSNTDMSCQTQQGFLPCLVSYPPGSQSPVVSRKLLPYCLP